MRTAGGNKTALIGLVLCLWGLAAAADPREVHKRGVEALEAGRWADAERFFRAAIAERSEERAGTILGRRYLPHYYLGVALAEQGRCRGALEAWAESARQGKIDKVDELELDLRRRRGRCQEHLRQVDELKVEVEGLLGQAESSAASLESFAAKPMLAPRWSLAGSYADRLRAARERLAGVRQTLAQGFDRADLEILGQARDLAAGSLESLRGAIDDARRELGELSAATSAALESLEAAADRARAAVRSIADLEPHPPGLGRRKREVERLLATIAQGEDAAQAGELERLEAELGEAVARLERAARRPPRTLVAAVEAFLDGRYREVLELLEETRFREVRTRTHICVLRAASRYALFVLGGEEDPELRDRAAEEAVACRELDPDFEPPAKYHSPRFLDFYATAGAAPEDESLLGETEDGEGESDLSSATDTLPLPEAPRQHDQAPVTTDGPPPSPREGAEGGMGRGPAGSGGQGG